MPYNYEGPSATTATFSPGTPPYATTSITYAGGESVIVTVSAWGLGTITTPTVVDDSTGGDANVYIYIGTWGEHQSLFYCHNCKAGTYTLTFGRAAGQIGSIRAYKFSGLKNAAPIVSTGLMHDGSGAASPDNVPVGSPNVTTVPALLFAVTRRQSDSADVVAGTGFTTITDRLLHEPTPGTINGGAMHRRITSTGAVSTNFSAPPNDAFNRYISAVVAFEELSPPTITTQPVAKQVMPGDTANFTVSATGTGGLSYQWQKSTDGGTSFSNVSGGSGGTSASYTTAATALSDNGAKFRCVVTDSNGSTNTADVWLHLFNQSLGRASKEFRFGFRLSGWMFNHNLDRSYRNVLFRERITWADKDSTEQITWQNWFFPAPTRMKIMNSGSQWVARSTKVWDGTSWVPKPNRIFNGVNWT